MFKTYVPMRADFEKLLSNVFATARLSESQTQLMEQVFYAGAASAYSILVNEPLRQGPVFDELADHARRFDVEKVN